jgi:uncharacterized protein YcbK (DUF882 family)
MGDLTKDFSRWEFECPCGCGFDTVDHALVTLLQELRNDLGARITINSGCRCDSHNDSVGGSENSQHLYGRAADIVVDGLAADIVYGLLDTEEAASGLGSYDGWTHVDTRSNGPARW